MTFRILRILLLALTVAACDRDLPVVSGGSEPGGWPNEPAGTTVMTDWGFDQAPPTAGDVPIPGSPGWSIVFGVPPGPTRGWVRSASDPTAPFSPPHVYDFVYPEGMIEGSAPGTVYLPAPQPRNHGLPPAPVGRASASGCGRSVCGLLVEAVGAL